MEAKRVRGFGYGLTGVLSEKYGGWKWAYRENVWIANTSFGQQTENVRVFQKSIL